MYFDEGVDIHKFESKTCELKNDLHLVNHPSDGGPSFPRCRSFVAKLGETRLQHGVPTNKNETGNNFSCGHCIDIEMNSSSLTARCATLPWLSIEKKKTYYWNQINNKITWFIKPWNIFARGDFGEAQLIQFRSKCSLCYVTWRAKTWPA